MRVIGGKFRSRRLKSVPGLTVRPTPSRLREALFNILSPVIGGSVFLDAYAGSGTVAIEAFSRGASSILLIERQAAALQVIRENILTLGIQDSAKVVRAKAADVIGKYAADIAFVDPPYDMEAEYAAALLNTRASLVVAQHASRLVLDKEYGKLRKYRVLRQGDNSLSFFE